MRCICECQTSAMRPFFGLETETPHIDAALRNRGDCGWKVQNGKG